MSSDGIAVLEAIKSMQQIFKRELGKMTLSVCANRRLSAHIPQYPVTFIRRKYIVTLTQTHTYNSRTRCRWLNFSFSSSLCYCSCFLCYYRYNYDFGALFEKGWAQLWFLFLFLIVFIFLYFFFSNFFFCHFCVTHLLKW